jgi:hypothetical protein
MKASENGGNVRNRNWHSNMAAAAKDAQRENSGDRRKTLWRKAAAAPAK